MTNTQIILFLVIGIIIQKNYNYIVNYINNLVNNAKLLLTSNNSSNKNKEINKPYDKSKKLNEGWRDLPFSGYKDFATYHTQNQNISRKSLPIYYPISSPLEDNYFNYLNSITSPKLSMLRNIMRSVEEYTNQGNQPIIFNYAERPVEIKKIDKERVKTLAKTVIDLINKFAKTYLRVELDNILNEVHEETETQSRINFDMKIKLFYVDYEKLGKSKTQPFDIIFVQPEFIFEKIYKFQNLPEDQFFKKDGKDIKFDFKAYLSKLMIVGSEHLGFLGGQYDKKPYNRRK